MAIGFEECADTDRWVLIAIYSNDDRDQSSIVFYFLLMNFSSQYRYLCSDQSSIVLISHVIYPRYIFYIYFSIFYLYRTFFFLREKKRNNNSLTDLSFSNVTKKGIVLLNFNLSSLNINILLTGHANVFFVSLPRRQNRLRIKVLPHR